jgi:hypothetical protein
MTEHIFVFDGLHIDVLKTALAAKIKDNLYTEAVSDHDAAMIGALESEIARRETEEAP